MIQRGLADSDARRTISNDEMGRAHSVMAQITWTNEALRWLEDIFEYIAADNPTAASETVEGIFERAQVLAEYPEMASDSLAHRGTCASWSTGITESRTCSRVTEISTFLRLSQCAGHYEVPAMNDT
jgi:plasmid stabilization system protein ParE